MKIEVTHSWTQGAIRETTTVSVDMQILSPGGATAEEISEFVAVLKKAAVSQEPPGKLRDAEVNVYVDGVKQGVESNAPPSAGEYQPPSVQDQRLGRLVGRLPEGMKLARSLDGTWVVLNRRGEPFEDCLSPDEALLAAGVAP